jgi:hypothetical protein
MAADYSRTTYDRRKHYSGVLMQQGRVQLDADWNEQRDIAVHFLRALARDVIGPHGGPAGGFELARAVDSKGAGIPYDFTIAPGHYYVDGILCENDGRWPAGATAPAPFAYRHQPDYPLPADEELQADGAYLVYLDVWEREIIALQDDDIREVGLGGPDTAARSKVIWQVRVLSVKGAYDFDEDHPARYLQSKRPPLTTGRLRAKALQEQLSDDPCIVSPGAGYRGQENRLYRVEIHREGTAPHATFKWSRDNGAAVLAIAGTGDSSVTVESLGRDSRLSVAIGDWVEVLDDSHVLNRRVEPLLQVQDVDPVERLVTLDASPPQTNAASHPLLRRWDQRKADDVDLVDGAIPLREGIWLDLEDGVQVYFEAGGTYQAGDFWEIPARTATGDVDWPGPPNDPAALPARGVRDHYAPLRLITLDGAGQVALGREYRRTINPIASTP